MSWTNPPAGPADYGSGILPFAGSPLPGLMIRQLRPGERVLWVGRPNRARLVQLSDLPALGFGALWTAIVVTAMAGLMRSLAGVHGWSMGSVVKAAAYSGWHATTCEMPAARPGNLSSQQPQMTRSSLSSTRFSQAEIRFIGVVRGVR